MIKRIDIPTIINDSQIGKVTDCYISHAVADIREDQTHNPVSKAAHLLIAVNLDSKQAVSILYDFENGVDLSNPSIKHRARSIRSEYQRNPFATSNAEVEDFVPKDVSELLVQITKHEELLRYVMDWLDCDQASHNQVEWDDIDFNRPLGTPHNSEHDPKQIKEPYERYVDKAILGMIDADKQVSLISGAMQSINAAGENFKLMHESTKYGDRYSLFDKEERINIFLMDEYLSKNAATSIKGRIGK